MAYILYIGDNDPGSTSAHRAKALERLGHDVTIKNPFSVFYSRKFEFFHFRTGYGYVQSAINRWVNDIKHSIHNIDLIWVDSGELLGPQAVQMLKELDCPVIIYNIDDPTGNRDGKKFKSLLKALPYYDLIAVVREETKAECEQLGAKNVIRVYRSYDEVAHMPFEDQSSIPAQYYSDMAFIGTWMRHEKRDLFLLHLIRQGIKVKIWGGRWHKSPYWEQLRPHYAGDNLSGRNYVAAIQGAKVCLGLLSKGNRDLHTTRSLEIPYAGGLLFAERTSEHLAMYEEGVEAVFWSDTQDCAIKCLELLKDNERLNSIREAGRKRVIANQAGNENICKSILEKAFALQQQQQLVAI